MNIHIRLSASCCWEQSARVWRRFTGHLLAAVFLLFIGIGAHAQILIQDVTGVFGPDNRLQGYSVQLAFRLGTGAVIPMNGEMVELKYTDDDGFVYPVRTAVVNGTSRLIVFAADIPGNATDLGSQVVI